MSDLHDRIAKVLGWKAADVQSLSLASLRDLVRPVNPDLAAEVSLVIQSGAHIRGAPRAPKARSAAVARRLKAIDKEAQALEDEHGRNWLDFPPEIAKKHRALFEESLRLQNPHAFKKR